VHAIKYILLLFLWVEGCVCSMSGIGPGLVSMSPLRSSRECFGDFVNFCGIFSFTLLFVFSRFFFFLSFYIVVVYVCVCSYFGV
jgi:hypothetical protein